MESRTCVVSCFFVIFFLIFMLFASVFPKTYELYIDRQTFLRDGPSMFKKGELKPSVRQRQFYFFNVTNEDELRTSGAQMRVEEIGPFTYNVIQNGYKVPTHANASVEYSSYTELEFVPDNSIAPESVTIHLPLHIDDRQTIKTSQSPAQRKHPGVLIKRTVKTLVNDLLSNGGVWGSSSHLQRTPSNGSANSSTYELCQEVSVLHKFLNDTFFNDSSTLSVYQTLPCRSVTFANKGSHMEEKSHPHNFNMLVTRIVLVWNTKVETFKANHSFQDIDFSLPPSKISFICPSFLASFDMEPSSTIVTNFKLQYTMEFLLEYLGNYSNLYITQPFFRTEIRGKSTPSTDEFLYRYIIFPRIFKDQILPRIVFFAVCFLVVSSTIIYLLMYHSHTLEEGEKAPLLKPSTKILINSYA